MFRRWKAVGSAERGKETVRARAGLEKFAIAAQSWLRLDSATLRNRLHRRKDEVLSPLEFKELFRQESELLFQADEALPPAEDKTEVATPGPRRDPRFATLGLTASVWLFRRRIRSATFNLGVLKGAARARFVPGTSTIYPRSQVADTWAHGWSAWRALGEGVPRDDPYLATRH